VTRAVVNIHEAKTQLSKLLERVEEGEEVIIARGGKPIARLLPIGARAARQPGFLGGRVQMADDFDAPLPPDVLAALGAPIEPPTVPTRSPGRRR
jgi:prevent-host-death family protein